MQMALRGVNVILKQGETEQLVNDYNIGSNLRNRLPPFIAKMFSFRDKSKAAGVTNASPRLNEYYKGYMSCDSFHTRRNFLKALTDNLLIPHLESKGWTSNTEGCRIHACEAESETLEHMLTHIPHEDLDAKAKRDFSKALTKEKKRKRFEHPRLDLGAQAALLLANVFGEISEPPLKICKKTVVARGRGRPATRRQSLIVSKAKKRKNAKQASSLTNRNRRRLNAAVMLACLWLIFLGLCVAGFINVKNSENLLPVQKYFHHCHEIVPEKKLFYLKKIIKNQKMPNPDPTQNNDQKDNNQPKDDPMGQTGGINPFEEDAQRELARQQQQQQQQQPGNPHTPMPRSVSTLSSITEEEKNEEKPSEGPKKSLKELLEICENMNGSSTGKKSSSGASTATTITAQPPAATGTNGGDASTSAINSTEPQADPNPQGTSQLPRSESSQKIGQLFKEKDEFRIIKKKIYEPVAKIDREKKEIMDMAKAKCEGLDKLRKKQVKICDKEFQPYKERYLEIGRELDETFRTRPARMAERGEEYVKRQQPPRRSSQSPKPKKSKRSKSSSKSVGGSSTSKKSEDSKSSEPKKSDGGEVKTSIFTGRSKSSGSRKSLTSNPLRSTERDPECHNQSIPPTKNSQQTRKHQPDNGQDHASVASRDPGNVQSSSSMSHGGRRSASPPRRHSVARRSSSNTARRQSPQPGPSNYRTNHPFNDPPHRGPFDGDRYRRTRQEEERERRAYREMRRRREREDERDAREAARRYKERHGYSPDKYFPGR